VYSQRNLPRVNLKDDLREMPETKTYEGVTYHVWRPTDEEIEKKGYGRKYLVDDQGQVCYLVDPTITGTLEQRDVIVQAPPEAKAVNLKGQLDELRDTLAQRDPETGKLVYFHVWKKEKGDSQDNLEAGEYLVDDSGRVVGRIEGEKVKLKFEAPKTQVMGIIIKGVLRGKLNWTMVLIGAFLAIGLELCGVSSLAFAVGVYIPMSASTPIFLGGLARWGVDAFLAGRSRARLARVTDPEARARAEVEEIARTETNAGVLLASGLIAGGSMGGVLLAFFEFSPDIKNGLDMTKRLAGTFWDPAQSGWVYLLPTLGAFAVLILLLLLSGMGKLFRQPEGETTDDPAAPGKE
jgi:hypothetical protein